MTITTFSDQAAGPEDGGPGMLVRVDGTPAPQGSKYAIMVKGKPVVIEQNSGPVNAWRAAVKAAALAQLPGQRPRVAGPVRLNVAFWMGRPLDHYGTGRNAGRLKESAPAWPGKRPDLDKLLRSTMDALTGISWLDDSQVVEISAAKHYALSTPGASIAIVPLGEHAHVTAYPPAPPGGQGRLDPLAPAPGEPTPF